MYQRYLFFKEHAGYVVGRSAEGALSLARAEVLLEQAIELEIATVKWEDDDEPYEHCGFSDEQIAEKFESNEWTGPLGCVVQVGDDIASLWGIVVGPRGTNDPYCRVVAAELAMEVEDELRQAIGDALDAAEPALFAGPDLSDYNTHGPLI